MVIGTPNIQNRVHLHAGICKGNSRRLLDQDETRVTNKLLVGLWYEVVLRTDWELGVRLSKEAGPLQARFLP